MNSAPNPRPTMATRTFLAMMGEAPVVRCGMTRDYRGGPGEATAAPGKPGTLARNLHRIECPPTPGVSHGPRRARRGVHVVQPGRGRDHQRDARGRGD